LSILADTLCEPWDKQWSERVREHCGLVCGTQVQSTIVTYDRGRIHHPQFGGWHREHLTVGFAGPDVQLWPRQYTFVDPGAVAARIYTWRHRPVQCSG